MKHLIFALVALAASGQAMADTQHYFRRDGNHVHHLKITSIAATCLSPPMWILTRMRMKARRNTVQQPLAAKPKKRPTMKSPSVSILKAKPSIVSLRSL